MNSYLITITEEEIRITNFGNSKTANQAAMAAGESWEVINNDLRWNVILSEDYPDIKILKDHN